MTDTVLAGLKDVEEMRAICAAEGLRWTAKGAPDMRRFHSGNCPNPKRARILALLESNCLTFHEIGQRVGLSRERIRQYAEKYGFDKGRTRQSVCMINCRVQAQEKKLAALHPDLRAKCEEHKLTFVPLLNYRGHKSAIIGGYRCSIHRITKPAKTYPDQKSSMGRVWRPSKYDSEFFVTLEPDGFWYIFPSHLWKRGMFTLEPLEEWRTPIGLRRRRKVHDTFSDKCRACKEAWHLLGGK